MFLLVLAVWGKHITGAANRADDARMVRIGLDLPPDAGDAHVDGAVEGVRVAGVRKVEEPLARQHPPRMVDEGLEEVELRGRQRVVDAFVVLQHAGLDIEPLRPEADLLPGGPGRARAADDRADAGHELAQLGGLCQIVVGAELEADDAVDRARRRGQHDDRHVGRFLEVADDRQPVLLRHVEVEHDEVRLVLGEALAQARAAVAQGDLEAVQLEVVADHVPGGGLVVDDEDVRRNAHGSTQRSVGSRISKTAPLPWPSLAASIVPPWSSTMRLAIDRPSPVEVSPPVGRAERRWKRPNRRDMSSRLRPGPLSLTRIEAWPRLRATATSMAAPFGLYLIALLIRLSIASASRSWSPSSETSGALPTLIVCSLRSASVRFAPATSATSAPRSIGSLRIWMSSASLIASAIRVSTISVRRFAESRIWPICAAAASFARGFAARSSDSISARPRMTPSGFLRSWATVPRISLLKRLAWRSCSDWPARRSFAAVSSRVRLWTRSSRPAFACCSCSYRMTLSKAAESRLQNTSTSARSVSDRLLPASRMTTTSRPLPVPM